MLSYSQLHSLKEHGFLILEPEYTTQNIISDKNISLLRNEIERLIAEEGPTGGSDHLEESVIPERGCNRLSNLVDKISIVRPLIDNPTFLEIAEIITGNSTKLSAINMREPLINNGQQDIHIDWAPRRFKNEPFSSCLIALALDDMDSSNGGLTFLPGSHKILGDPQWKSYSALLQRIKGTKTMHTPMIKAGSVIAYYSHLWHGGTVNLTGSRRRILFIGYRASYAPQQLPQKNFIPNNHRGSLSKATLYNQD